MSMPMVATAVPKMPVVKPSSPSISACEPSANEPTSASPIEIAVIDNGPGIDPALRDHVFEPFVTSKKSGQGLGLALVRKLVRDMAGRISHDRDEKAGLTQFRIHLPLAREGAAR